MKGYVDYYAVPTLEVESPFSYTHVVIENDYVDIGPRREIIDSVESRVANYRPYNVHCFVTQFSQMIKSINPALSFCLVHKRDGNVTRLFVELKEGGIFRPITSDTKPLLEKMVKLCATKPNDILLFRPNSDIYYNDACIPFEWMAGVLPYAEISHTVVYDDSEQNINPYYHDGGIYITLDPDSCYTDIETSLKFQIYDYLSSLYTKGCVVLSATLESRFIIDWDMERHNSYDVGDHALYCPKWSNVYAAQSPTEFITSRLLGNEWARFDIGHDERRRYSMSKAIKGFSHAYCDKYLLVKVSGIKDLNSVTSLLLSSRQLDASDGEAVTYEDLLRGTIKII